MPTTFAAQMRRMQRMMRPARMTKKSRSMLIGSAYLPFAAFAANSAKSKRKSVGKASDGVTARQKAMANVPDGATFSARRHRSKWGSREFLLYLPASAPKKPTGLILMLHGCGQNSGDFAMGTHMNALAEKHGLAIAYPEQTKRHNRGLCWNWFTPGHQIRGAGEPAILASLARKLTKELCLERDVVFVAGLSAGGCMAAILADVYPDVFSAAAIHSGVARGGAYNVMSAMSAMRSGAGSGVMATIAPPTGQVRRIVFQGESDATVHPSNAPAIVKAAIGDDAEPEKTISRSLRGRTYTRSHYAESDSAAAVELWLLEGAGHAWSGGRAAGSYTDRNGPDASAQIVRFFLKKP